MNSSTYTTVPDTADTNYWRLKRSLPDDKLKVFVPINRELHRSILTKQREAFLRSRPIRRQGLDS